LAMLSGSLTWSVLSLKSCYQIESKIKEVQDKIDSLLRERKLLEEQKRVTEFSLRSLQDIHELYKVTKVDLG